MFLLDDHNSDSNRQNSTSFMNTNLSMATTQPSFSDSWFIGEDRRHLAGILLFILVLLVHLCVKNGLLNLAPIKPPEPKIVEIEILVAPPPPPVAPPAPPAPPTPPKVEPPKPKPKPLPPKPKPVPKPKPKPVDMPKPDDFKIPEPTPIKAAPVVSAPPAPRPAPAPAPAPAPNAGKVAQGNQKPTCVSCPHPHYPSVARRHNWQGTVKLRIQIASDGDVSSVTVLSSSGYEELDEAAIEDVKDWRFASGDAGTTRVATQSINFKLDN